MYLIDRKKNIFKLSQGEYIIPDKLEKIYQESSPNIHEVFVYGDSKRHNLVGVVNINEIQLEKL